MPLRQLRLLVSAATVDGELAEADHTALTHAARELGICPSRVDEIRAELAKGTEVDLDIPADPTDRTRLFHSLVAVLASDGCLLQRQATLLHRLGPRFDLREDEITLILDSDQHRTHEFDCFRLLASMAVVDRRLDQRERSILLKVAHELGISDAQVEGVLAELVAGGDINEVVIPTDPKQRAELFCSLVDLAAADGTIEPAELALFQRLASRFNLSELEVEDILHAAVQARRGRS